MILPKLLLVLLFFIPFMILAIIFSVLLIPILIMFSLALPLIIGYLVYTDAKKRNIPSAALWAIFCAIPPFFIGLVLYAIFGISKGDSGSAS